MNKVLVFIVMMSLAFAFSGCQKSQQPKDEYAVEDVEIVGSEETQAAKTQVGSEVTDSQNSDALKTAVQPVVDVTVPIVELVKTNENIQKALAAAGFYTGQIDGKIGPKSKLAIKEFQKAKGLVVDGVVGSKTWNELKQYLINKPETDTNTLSQSSLQE